MSDADHAPDCALVLYPDAQDARCDCEASDPEPRTTVEHEVEPTASGPVVTLTGSAARALGEFRRVVLEHRKREAVLLAKLTEELAK